jgi:hypothetical protein
MIPRDGAFLGKLADFDDPVSAARSRRCLFKPAPAMNPRLAGAAPQSHDVQSLGPSPVVPAFGTALAAVPLQGLGSGEVLRERRTRLDGDDGAVVLPDAADQHAANVRTSSEVSERERAGEAGVDLGHEPVGHGPDALFESVSINGRDLGDVEDGVQF